MTIEEFHFDSIELGLSQSLLLEANLIWYWDSCFLKNIELGQVRYDTTHRPACNVLAHSSVLRGLHNNLCRYLE